MCGIEWWWRGDRQAVVFLCPRVREDAAGSRYGWGHPLSALGPQGFSCLSSTPWSPLSPFRPAEVTSGSCGGRGAPLARVARGSLGEQGRLGGCVAPGHPLRLWGQGSESVLVPAQLLAWDRDRTGWGSWNQPRLQLRALRGRQAYVCTPAHMRAHTHHSFWASCHSWVPMHAGQSLPAHRFLSACTCLFVLSYTCTHTNSPGHPCLSTHMCTYV